MVYILSVFFLQNAVCLIILTYLIPVLFTFYVQGVLKLKKIIPAPKVKEKNGEQASAQLQHFILAQRTPTIASFFCICFVLF